MTASDRSIPSDVLQSFFQLRDSVDAFSCLASMIPEGGSDGSLGHLLRMISCSLNDSLDSHWRSIADAEFVKR